MKTFASLYGGFGGTDIGAQTAGLELAWSIEQNAAIADVAHANLHHRVHVTNILDCDPMDFDAVDVLHASPPCPNFSVANPNSGETDLDIALACKTAAFVTTLKPSIFTLENVWAYHNSQSWRILESALWRAGYWLHAEHVNAADYQVPQTRKRMIVRAVRGGFVPYLPEPLPWIGWYAAVADLIDTLPETQFAPWQMARLPELLQTVLVPQGGDQNYDLGVKSVDEPSMTITANHNQLGIKAFLVQVQGQGGDGIRFADEPMQTVTANHLASKYRAFLMAGGAMPKAWLVNESSTMEVRAAVEPSACHLASGRNTNQRALLSSGRVVAMTPRALARFQSFPDWYELPGNARLAAKGIGNAVAPLLYQRIIAPLVEIL